MMQGALDKLGARSWVRWGLCLSLGATVPATSAIGGGDSAGEVARAMKDGLRFLAATQQPDGGWKGHAGTDPAVTALVVKCFIQSPDYGPTHPIAQRGIRAVLRYVQPDGGIYVPDRGLRNYGTSVSLMALSATHDPAYAETIERAQRFLKKGQWDEGERIDRANEWYGGAGYGKHKRPDLSNTQMMLEALAQSGLAKDDPVYQRAVAFVSRCQMLGESNDLRFARGASDGGFIYSPANGGESKAGKTVVAGRERLRSYGSMSYAGFKSLLYAGLRRDDPRVKAAYDWIRRNYTLQANPNMPGAQSREGLYYYFHVMARALSAWGDDHLIDSRGVAHDWRRELCAELLRLQRPDGSWVNSADRWYEGNPYLVTAYAVLTLQTAAR